MTRIPALFLALASLCAPATAEEIWLPAHVRESLAQSIAEKLQAIDEDGKVTPETAMAAAQTVIGGVGAKLESLGIAKVIDMAPAYPGLELPTTGTNALNAIVAYQLCSVPFDHEYRDDSPREHRYDLRAWGLFLSASVYVVSSYLRQGYLEAGVTDEQAQAHLGGEAVTSLRARIDGSDELLQSVNEQCGDPFVTFMR
jgi:hypothetical protein